MRNARGRRVSEDQEIASLGGVSYLRLMKKEVRASGDGAGDVGVPKSPLSPTHSPPVGTWVPLPAPLRTIGEGGKRGRKDGAVMWTEGGVGQEGLGRFEGRPRPTGGLSVGNSGRRGRSALTSPFTRPLLPFPLARPLPQPLRLGWGRWGLLFNVLVV
jgi:hypothetical protein